MGTGHGGQAAQDPPGLPSLPSDYPRGRLATAQATVGSVRAVMPQQLPLNDWPVVNWAAIDLYTERATEAPKACTPNSRS